MTDDDDVLAAAGDCGSDVLEGCSGESRSSGSVSAPSASPAAAGLARAQSGLVSTTSGRASSALAARRGAGLLAAEQSAAQLVRLSGGGFGMTDEVEAHGAGG